MPRPGERLYLQTEAPSMPKLVLNEISENKFPPAAMAGTANARPSLQPAEARFVFHTVQPKETMYAIAKKYEVAVEDIMKWNAMQSIDLKSGQLLRIQKNTANATN